jgi:hypothetical protein
MTIRTLAAATAIVALAAHTASAQMTMLPPIQMYQPPPVFNAVPAPMHFNTVPNVYGAPQYGTTTTGPGIHCTSTPNVYGAPQYGFSTHCN